MDNQIGKAADQGIEEEDNFDGASESIDQPDDVVNTMNANTSATSASGLQQIEDDNNDLPLPMGMAEEAISNTAEPPKQKIGKVEQMDDDVGPEPHVAMLEASLNAVDITNKIAATSSAVLEGSASDMNYSTDIAAYLTEALQSGRINNLKEAHDILNSFNSTKPTTTTKTTRTEYMNEISPPVPFNSAEFEEDDDDVIAKKKAKEDMDKKPAVEVLPQPSNRDSIYEPSREVIEGSEGMSDNTNTGRGGTNRRGWVDIESRVARRDIESQTRTNNHEDSIDNDSMTDANVEPTSTNQGLPEVEAYLVEDVEEEVFIATPTLPWWKQKRIALVIVIVGTLSIVLTVELLVSRPTSIVTSTNAPSISLAPSSSMSPSSSPTECVNKIISNAQEIDLQNDLQVSTPRMPNVAMDGLNMVIFLLDGKYCASLSCTQYDGPIFVTFYSLDDNAKWQRVQTPISEFNTGSGSSVAISGSTAFVGVPGINDNTGNVIVYEQNKFDEWVQADNPFVHYDETTHSCFGSRVDIYQDLACVGGANGMNLYHQDSESKWVQFDTIEGVSDCSISGDTILMSKGESIQLYKYNQDLNRLVPIQDLLLTGSAWPVYLSNNYLVYGNYDLGRNERDIFIYQRDEANQTFSLYQRQLNISGLSMLALDDDILVVGNDNHTYIYSLQNGIWEEIITLDVKQGRYAFDYKISGRTLLYTKYNETSTASEMYSFNIQDCAQDMPTQSPILSPSTPPTTTSSPTSTFRHFDANDGGYGGILYKSVRSYISQDCANDKECDIAQVYGWPMNSWYMGNVVDMSSLFSNMDTFNENVSGWNTTSAKLMSSMFYYASSFDGEVSKFDTSSVTRMDYMFMGANSFNRDLSNFDTLSVVSMFDMFNGAESFNQDLCSWQESFPYTADNGGIFTNSNCTYQDTPEENKDGPFCASNCRSY